MTDDVRRARRAFLWVGVIVPLVIIAVASIIVAAWLPEIPEPAAIHWGSDGVDGFGPGWTYLVLLIGLGGGMVVFFAVIALFAHRLPGSRADQPQWSMTARFLGAVNLGTASFLSLLGLVTVGVQRGLTDAADAPNIVGPMILGLSMLVGLSVVGWIVQPTIDPVAAEAYPAERIELAPGEKAAWLGTATMSRLGVVVLVIAVVFLAVRTVTLIIEGDSGWWIFAVTTVVIALLVGSTLTFRVRVNARGLAVRSFLGWPRTDIPIAEIEKIETVLIDPFREFGGWGWRLGLDGRRGIVLHNGEALQVTRTDERVFVVTVAGASEAAAVLEGIRVATASDQRKDLS